MSSPLNDAQSMTPWIHSLPKVEMHAHLSGSVREETVLQLLKEEAEQEAAEKLRTDGTMTTVTIPAESEIRTFQFGDRTLSECFHVFKILHRLVSSLSVVARITREVIQDFASENTVYLELRTTPRVLGKDANATTKKQYVETVVQTIRECEEKIRTTAGEKILVRLLLSIDRSQQYSEAVSTLELAIEFARQPNPIVVGLDFSGNPTVGSFRSFLPIFEKARAAGLKSSIHVGEKLKDGDDLDCALFQFKPERLGHVVCLEQRHIDHLLEHPVPIEICPTSNLKTQIVKEWKQHPFGHWRSEGKKKRKDIVAEEGESQYPLIVCTDDSGVFNITLTSELQQLSEAFQMDRHELFHLEQRALEHGFVSEDHKKELRAIFERFHQTCDFGLTSATSHTAASSTRNAPLTKGVKRPTLVPDTNTNTDTTEAGGPSTKKAHLIEPVDAVTAAPATINISSSTTADASASTSPSVTSAVISQVAPARVGTPLHPLTFEEAISALTTATFHPSPDHPEYESAPGWTAIQWECDRIYSAPPKEQASANIKRRFGGSPIDYCNIYTTKDGQAFHYISMGLSQLYSIEPQDSDAYVQSVLGLPYELTCRLAKSSLTDQYGPQWMCQTFQYIGGRALECLPSFDLSENGMVLDTGGPINRIESAEANSTLVGYAIIPDVEMPSYISPFGERVHFLQLCGLTQRELLEAKTFTHNEYMIKFVTQLIGVIQQNPTLIVYLNRPCCWEVNPQETDRLLAQIKAEEKRALEEDENMRH